MNVSARAVTAAAAGGAAESPARTVAALVIGIALLSALLTFAQFRLFSGNIDKPLDRAGAESDDTGSDDAESGAAPGRAACRARCGACGRRPRTRSRAVSGGCR